MRKKLTNVEANKRSGFVALRAFIVRRDYSPPTSGEDLRARAAVRELWLPDAAVPGADLSGLDLTGAWLPGSDLRGTNLQGTVLRQANLRGADLTEAQLAGADILDASFDRATRWPDGFDPTAAGAVGPGARRSGSTVHVLAKEDLNDAHLVGSTLHGDLSGAKLAGARLAGASLREISLVEADLSGADLTGADLFEVEAENANFSGASLCNASLENANLQGACLREADFSGADVRNAEISFVTYQRSGWGPAALGMWIERGADIVDRDAFPAEVWSAAFPKSGGLTLWFDARLHRFDATAFDVLIAQVLGPDTDVTIEERSNIAHDGPGFLRINGTRPEDLVAVAEAFYERVWRSAEATIEERAAQKAMSSGLALVVGSLDKLRGSIARVEDNTALLADEEVREAVLDRATEHIQAKRRREFSTRIQRLGWALLSEVKKRTLDLVLGEGVADTALEIAGEVVDDAHEAIEGAEIARFERRLREAEEDES